MIKSLSSQERSRLAIDHDLSGWVVPPTGRGQGEAVVIDRSKNSSPRPPSLAKRRGGVITPEINKSVIFL